LTTDDYGAGFDNPKAAMLPYRFSTTNPGKSFSTRIGYRIYGPLRGSADGMTFVLHQDPRGITAQGLGGGNMGVYNQYVSGGAGIKPALVIEFDTCKCCAIVQS
jgi:Bacterial lectin